MIKFNRTDIHNKYFKIGIFECPIDIIIFAASLGSENVTIENYTHYINPDSISFKLFDKDISIEPKIKRYEIDFQINKKDFINLKRIWDSQGCYAVFCETPELKFKAIELTDLSRYKALDNFKWTLELAIPSSASDGWGTITSPNKDIIDKIEKYINNSNLFTPASSPDFL